MSAPTPHGSYVQRHGGTRDQGRSHPPHQPNSQGSQSSMASTRYRVLPDLRFLNYHDPPTTATSILDPMSMNSAGVQQFQALKEAEAWFVATAVMLRSRLELCERFRDGLVEVNRLLVGIEAVKKAGEERTSRGQGEGAGAGQVGEVAFRNRVSVDDGGQDLIRSDAHAGYGTDLPGRHDGTENGDAHDDPGEISTADDARDERKSPDMSLESTEDTQAEVRDMEEAVELWIRDIRVSRAKWMAGGRDVGR